MIEVALLAIGLVLIVEGLVYALAPSLVEDLLDRLRTLPLETRRMMGLVAFAAGVLLAWLAKTFGAKGVAINYRSHGREKCPERLCYQNFRLHSQTETVFTQRAPLDLWQREQYW